MVRVLVRRLCPFASALLIMFISVPRAAHAASFDCSRDTSRIEKLICRDDDLSRLDDELASAYQAATSAAGKTDQIRREQRQWLTARNACADRACVKAIYDRRLADLRALRTSSQPVPVDKQGSGAREIRSAEFKHFDGVARIDGGRVVFSHYDQSGNAHNIVAMNIGDGTASNLVEGVRGGRFVAEDKRYLVYSSAGANANPLVLFDKRVNKRVASVRLQQTISWAHIDGDRLLLLQSGMSHNNAATVLVYRLPALQLERTAQITGGNDTALWGDKIVSIGYRLGIYDLDLRQIAVVDLPVPDPSLRVNCGGGPLRISGDKAVVGANCGRLAVVDLPAAQVERIIPTDSLFQSFAIAQGLIFTVDPEGKARDVRVFELASGRELARIGIDASFLAMQGNSLLAMKRKDFSTPVRFTLYEVDFTSIRSETFRIARVVNGCSAGEEIFAKTGDVHAALETCENAGIRSYLDATFSSAVLRQAIEKYARWLTLSLSRYGEGVTILERLPGAAAGVELASLIALGKRKALYLDPPPKEAQPSPQPDSPAVKRVPIVFGAFSNLIQFSGDRVYIARWSCGAGPGVTLEVLERATFRHIKSIALADCDDQQQDSINAIGVVPGYIVLGLTYRYEEDGRPTVAVVDARSLEIVKRGFVKQSIAGLREWRGALLQCASNRGDSNLRFDPVSARFAPASEDEARACANGDPVPLSTRETVPSTSDPVAETPHFRIYETGNWPLKNFRVTDKRSGVARNAGAPARQYAKVLAVPERDALVLAYYMSTQRLRLTRFDVETQTEIVLFELNPANRPITFNVWARYLFVALGRDLIAYDLDRRMVVGYEKELIREGFLNNCCGVDRDGITRLLQDGSRLIALTFDGTNSRVIDLPAYTGGLPTRDFFLAGERK